MSTWNRLLTLSALFGAVGLGACAPTSAADNAGAGAALSDRNGNPVATECGVMRAGLTMSFGDTVPSCATAASGEAKYYLLIDSDGNLVAAELGSGTYWSNHAPGTDHVTLEDSGDLVAYDATGMMLWHSDTAGNAGAQVKLGDDGNVSISIGDSTFWETGPR